jgi:hypothetical protein
MDSPVKFVNYCANYNLRTSTDILCRRECKLFSVRKIKHIVREKFANIPTLAPINTPTLAPTLDEITTIIKIICTLPNYSRIGGGMLICALSEYAPRDVWEEQLDWLAQEQNEKYLWAEPFLLAAYSMSGEEVPDKIIEDLADKLPASLLYDDIGATITFID